jgi:hypothetical protein
MKVTMRTRTVEALLRGQEETGSEEEEEEG